MPPMASTHYQLLLYALECSASVAEGKLAGFQQLSAFQYMHCAEGDRSAVF